MKRTGEKERKRVASKEKEVDNQSPIKFLFLSKTGQYVFQVSAEDSDLGSNGDLTYTLYNGRSTEADEYFNINSRTGTVVLKKQLTGRGL